MNKSTRGKLKVWESHGEVFLREILPWCFKHHHVDMLLVVSRGPSCEGRTFTSNLPAERAAAMLLGEKTITRFRACGWPGTALVRGKDLVYVAHFDEELMRRMIHLQNALSEWRFELPEDICLWRDGDSHPTFFSTTHERVAWVLSTKRSQPPCFFPSAYSLDDLQPFIWSGPFFCKKQQP